MKKAVLHFDIDNTLIYSYKHKTFKGGKCIERLDNEDFGYISDYTLNELDKLNSRSDIEVVPITTRTVEQYNRLDLPKFKYALVGNGGVLLIDGKSDKNWYDRTLESIKFSQVNMLTVYSFLQQIESRFSSLKFVDDLFMYFKPVDKDDIFDDIPRFSNLVYVKNLTKFYILPESLVKVEAVRRFKELISREITISAGDNPNLDWCMEESSDIFIKPKDHTIYSDEIFRYLSQIL